MRLTCSKRLMKIVNLARMLTAAIVMAAAPASAQSDSTLETIAKRLDLVDQQNAALRDSGKARTNLRHTGPTVVNGIRPR